MSGRRPCAARCEYTAGSHDDPVTDVLALTGYGRAVGPDGVAPGDEGSSTVARIENDPPVGEGGSCSRLVAEGGFEPPTKGL